MSNFDQNEIDTACAIINRYAEHLGVRPAVAANVIINHLKTYVSNDLRIRQWRIRLFIFNFKDENLADTDPTLEPNKPGSALISGLNNVIAYCAHTCAAFHKCEYASISHCFTSRYPTLRVMLSNGSGSATWRVPYFIGDERFTARIEIRKEG